MSLTEIAKSTQATRESQDTPPVDTAQRRNAIRRKESGLLLSAFAWGAGSQWDIGVHIEYPHLSVLHLQPHLNLQFYYVLFRFVSIHVMIVIATMAQGRECVRA